MLKAFDEKVMRRNEKQPRLIKSALPVPTIQPVGVYDETPSCRPLPSTSRKPPTQRIFQEDEMDQYRKAFHVTSFEDVDESLLNFLDSGYRFAKHGDHAVLYKFVLNELSIPQITECIRIDSSLHVKLFYKNSPVPLPPWFRKGTNCTFKSKDMLTNFSSYIRETSEKWGDVLDEIQQIRYMKAPVYSANLLRYSLMLRYSSLQAYKVMMEEFKLPSLALLQKLTAGKIDTMKTAKLLKETRSISEDVILMFDEMFLEKCEEYAGGETYGADDNGELYKGIMSFMIVGLRSSVPYVVKTLPEKKITGDWVKESLLSCLKMLQENGFNVRGTVCDDHSTNVNAYSEILKEYGQSPDDLFITMNGKKIYLFFDTVHLIKNVRNNLVGRKRFLFPEFHFQGFYDDIDVQGGEMSWGLLHKVHSKDAKLPAHLQAAPKLTSKVLHPGNCKQSVPPALAVFEESTAAGIKTYFPERDDAAGFLRLFNVWWKISNSKQRYDSSNRLGNAATLGDNKPEFLRAFADWLDKWDSEKIPNCEKFTLTAQTSAALKRTLRCQAALIEDLLSDGYDFVLTARFQSDPLERRYGQYRQMSGGRFLVSLKDVVYSEKILKIKSLIREGFDIDEKVKIDENYEGPLQILEDELELLIRDASHLALCAKSKEVSNHVAGYIAYKLEKYVDKCCGKRLLNEDSEGDAYHLELSRGGLKIASDALQNYVASAFDILDASKSAIIKSGVPSRIAGEHTLKKFLSADEFGFSCTGHESLMCAKVIRTVTNVFLNNKRKQSTESVAENRVAEMKRPKRCKSSV